MKYISITLFYPMKMLDKRNICLNVLVQLFVSCHQLYKQYYYKYIVYDNIKQNLLTDITVRIEQKLQELNISTKSPTIHYHTSLLEIVPQNCDVPQKLDLATEHYKIENMGRIEPLKHRNEGNQKVTRVFSCNFYKLMKV